MQCALLLKMGFAIYLRRNFNTLEIPCSSMSVWVQCLESYGGGRTHCGDNFGLYHIEEKDGFPSTQLTLKDQRSIWNQTGAKVNSFTKIFQDCLTVWLQQCSSIAPLLPLWLGAKDGCDEGARTCCSDIGTFF